MQVAALQGDTVDLICWRFFGRTSGVVEQVLALNSGLSRHGPILPMGTLLELPAVAEPDAVQNDVVKLWE